MKKLLSVFLALGMLMTGVFGAAAQDAETAYAVGLDAPATFTDERGNPVATLAVTEVEEDWADYDEYSAPDRGFVYRAVHFTVENVSGSSLIVEPYDFQMVDGYGRIISSSYASAAEDAGTLIFEEDTPLADGEVGEFMLVYETPADVPPAMLIWQPEGGSLIAVDFGTADVENGAIVSGLNTPATWTDDRGNVVATIEVTEVNPDWQDYDEYSTPERGMVFRAIHITITNVSDSSMIVEPYDITLLDSAGINNGRSYATAAEDSTEPTLEEDTALEAGESLETIVVFEMYTDLEPVALMWQPDSGITTMVNVSEGGEGDTESTPVDDSSTPVAATETEDSATTPESDDAEPTTSEDDDAESASVAAAPATVEGDDAVPASSTVSSGVTEVNGEPVTFVDAIEEEQGEIVVTSTLDGWEGYVDSQAPAEGTRFFLVTMEVTSTADDSIQVAPLDFTVVTESGGEYQADLFLNDEDADPQITESGTEVPAGETVEVVIPFVVPADEVPTQVIWETGTDTVELELAP